MNKLRDLAICKWLSQQELHWAVLAWLQPEPSLHTMFGESLPFFAKPWPTSVLDGQRRSGHSVKDFKLDLFRFLMLKEQHDTAGHNFQPIGFVDSCFPGRCGAPRQGILAPNTLGKIVLSKHIPPASLEGLSEYTHLWVVFIFDENTNACSEKGSKKEARTFPAKVSPPQLLGKRTGLFSTRTPHRPCPIGLTVVRIVSVDETKRCINIAGIDLVHNTPVLDVKPYIPAYDSIPDAVCAQWVREGGAPSLTVELSPAARSSLDEIVLPADSLYSDKATLLRALQEVLQLDIRSTHQGRGEASDATRAPYQVHFDCLKVLFRTVERVITVVHLSLDNVKRQRYRGASAAPAPIEDGEELHEEKSF